MGWAVRKVLLDKIFAALLLLGASGLSSVLQSSQLQRGPHKIYYDAILHIECIIVFN